MGLFLENEDQKREEATDGERVAKEWQKRRDQHMERDQKRVEAANGEETKIKRGKVAEGGRVSTHFEIIIDGEINHAKGDVP